RRSVFIQIPASTQIEGLFGYGKYSLSSLSQLGKMEKMGNRLLRQSLSEALAIPIFWDWEEKTMQLGEAAPRDRIKQVFSFSGIGKYLTGRYTTNLSLPTYLRLARAASKLTPATSITLDLAQAGVLTPAPLPDGTSVPSLDQERWDFVLGNTLADEEIRREGAAIAVYNTTATPTLGTRVARFLGHLGATVVTVGNSEERVGRCQLIGQASSLKTATAHLIGALLNCEKQVKEETTRAELILRVGSDFEARFQPRGRN
ncbi:MAG: LytR C-terminal domain-containing protein, partial [Patescibacteria group bacterium]